MEVELLNYTDERLCVKAARVCYDSGSKSTAETDAALLRNLIKSGHHSILEHSSATFHIKGISRTCSHQLVRHRLCTFSQRSQRYCSEENSHCKVPPSLFENKEAMSIFEEAAMHGQRAYQELIKAGVKKEDARFILPEGSITELVVTANYRQWRHILEERLSPRAQWEIRHLMELIKSELTAVAPICFEEAF